MKIAFYLVHLITLDEMESYDRHREEFKKLLHIAEHLVEAESHHKREEEVLFPEVEKRGVFASSAFGGFSVLARPR